MGFRCCPVVFLAAFLLAFPALGGPYFARGTFYAGSGAPWDCDAGNEMFDDGLHGDGAAGDGIYGVTVTCDQDVGPHDWKISTLDWTQNFPHHPSHPMANAVLFVMNPGEEIHFQLDTNTLGDGWQPATNAVACSNFDIPVQGFEFELIGSAPALGEWLQGIPVMMSDDLWYTLATIAEPGVHEYKFRVNGTWDICNIGIHYTMFIGENFTFETTEPNTNVRIEFNPNDGRSRAVLGVLIPVEELSWGQVKALYR